MAYTSPVYLTSQPYPVDVTESIKTNVVGMINMPTYDGVSENLTYSAAFMGGFYASGLGEYTDGLPEALVFGANMIAGTLQLGLLEYTNWPLVPDAMQIGQSSFQGGSLALGLIEYANWPTDYMTTNAAFMAGTLT